MEFAFCWREEYGQISNSQTLLIIGVVTDMLVAVLNTCTKEELEESEDDTTLVSPSSISSEDSLERRKVIKNKIMAVGRMARVFALLRSVS